MTCSTCRHWYMRPPDPAHLTAEVKGECRQAPPQHFLIPLPNGGIAAGWGYPLLPENFEACACHEHVPTSEQA